MTQKKYILKLAWTEDKDIDQAELLLAVLDFLEESGLTWKSSSVQEDDFYTQEELDDQKTWEETKEEVKGKISKHS